MQTVNVHEAKTQLSRLLALVEAGESIVIARHGKPIAQLVPVSSQPRQPGRLKGKIRLQDDFDAPLPDEMAAAFRGERPRTSWWTRTCISGG
jgi:prevent-host-death family protein